MLHFSKLQTAAIAFFCLLGILFALPNLFTKEHVDSWPWFVPKKQIVLGLDLQGGVHLVLQVERSSIIKDQLERIRDASRNALREAKIRLSGALQVQDNSVRLRIAKSEDVETAESRLRALFRSSPIDGSFFGSDMPSVTINRESNVLILEPQQPGVDSLIRQAVDRSIEVLRTRIDALGLAEPFLARQGTDRLLIEVPGYSDTAHLRDILERTAKMTFHLVEEVGPEAVSSVSSYDTKLLYTRARSKDSSSDVPANTDSALPLPVLVKKIPLLTGVDLIDAQAQLSPDTREPVVNFRFNTAGAKRFAEITKQNVGRMLAIVLDDEVITFPRINGPIAGGAGVISGDFTLASAADLAFLLRSGALPAKLNVVEERVVGPGLGADSVEAGKNASLIGIAGVVAYMVASYGLFGVFANIAVLINVIFTLAILSAFGVTLTLPGIAGIVLGVGMSVDANVLINERIREEQMRGQKPFAAVEIGFRKVMSTIFDANSTHILASLVLFYFGTGPIRGFAMTLIVGTLTSYVTAVSVTRMFIAQWMRLTQPKRVPL